MDELNQSFTDFQTLATESVARGERFSGLAAAFAEASRRIAHPAALLDAGLVYLSMNEPYARMLRLPPSALVGREYSQAHGDKRTGLALLQALTGGRPTTLEQDAPRPNPTAKDDGDGGGAWRVTPLLNAEAEPLGLVLEYCPGDASRPGRKD